MADGDEYESVYLAEKQSVDKGVSDDQAEYLEEAWKEQMELMETERKALFTEMFRRFSLIDRLIQS